MLDWLLTPLGGSAPHHVDPWIAWHARALVLAWGVLLPLGALAARYFKIAPGQDWPRELDHRLWWHAHRTLQYGGLGLAVAGVLLVVVARPRDQALPSALWHARLGWMVMALGLLQVLGGWLRGSKGGPTAATLRGDHYDMTLRRRVFERLHKSIGWLALALALAAIGLGLLAADAPRWMPCLLGLWWAGLALAALRLQRAGRCVDTYQAIWGPDPAHPGNAVEPIGWGVRRSSRAGAATHRP